MPKRITVNNPYIKDPANIKFLEENWETFLDYMAKNHSLVDCWHTVLNISSFDDAYVSSLIKKVDASWKRKIREETIQKRIAEGKKVSDDPNATAIEKKNAIFEEAIAEKNPDPSNDLLDDEEDLPD